MSDKSERTFTVVLTVTYSPTSTYDSEPEPVEIPGDMAGQLHNNIESCIERENLLNDIDGILEVEDLNLVVYEGPMGVLDPKIRELVEAYKRGYNWASEHGWEDEHGDK
jgi:hypothetical protein